MGHGRRRCLHIGSRHQLAFHYAIGLFQDLEQLRANGEAVAPSQFQNFAGIAEAGTHHDCFIAVRLVVVVDRTDRHHTRVF